MYRKNQVETASPAQLILLLYDAAIRHCQDAKAAIEQGSRDKLSHHLLKCQDIVVELMASLNFEQGGELAQRLCSLYDYIHRRLVHANVHRDAAAVQEAAHLLSGLREAWAQVASGRPAASGQGAGQSKPSK